MLRATFFSVANLQRVNQEAPIPHHFHLRARRGAYTDLQLTEHKKASALYSSAPSAGRAAPGFCLQCSRAYIPSVVSCAVVNHGPFGICADRSWRTTWQYQSPEPCGRSVFTITLRPFLRLGLNNVLT